MRKLYFVNNYKKAMYVIATLYFCITLNAQPITQRITGSVKDNTTGETLIGANIVVIGSNPVIGTTTNSEGNFILENIEVGTVSLRISFVGYKTVEIINRELRAGKALNINVFMEELILSGREVEIVGSVDKKGSVNTMTSVSSRTFTVDETRRYAGSRGDVARMASNFAGVQGASDDRNDIVIRGNSPSGLQWRLEGLEIPNPNHYGAFGTTGGPISMLNNNLLDNSDFLTGAFPSEYGNALSGVFDLRLRNGNSDNYEFIGMVGFNGFELGAEGPFSKKSSASFIANYRYSTMEFFEVIGMNFGTGTAVPKYKDFSFKVNLPTKKYGVFSLYGLGGSSEIDFLDSERDTNDVDFYGGEGWDLRNGSDLNITGINHIYNINSTSYLKTGLSFTYHYFYVKQDSIVPETKDVIPYYYSNFRENRLQFTTFYKKRLSIRNNIQTGININYYISNLHDSIFDEDYGKFNTLTSYEGTSALLRPYITWQFKLSDRLVFNTGVDYMYYTFNSTSGFEPRFGVKYNTGKSTTVSFAYGLHSQLLPSTTYNGQTYLGDGKYITFNKDLKLLKSHHFVLGFDWNISTFLRFKTEAYYQHIYDAAVNAHEEDTYSILNEGADFYIWNPDTLMSTGTGTNYGLEITLEHFLNNGVYFLATGSIFESKYKGSDYVERNTAFNSNFVTNLLAGKEWELNKNNTKQKIKKQRFTLGTDIKINWAGGRRYTPIDVEESKIEHEPVYITEQTYESRFPDYFRTDIKVYFNLGKRKLNYEWGIDIQNIFNNKNIYSQDFNTSTGELYYTYQLGIMVIPYFRIEF